MSNPSENTIPAAEAPSQPKPKRTPHEWQDKLGTPLPLFRLAVARAWHAALIEGDGVLGEGCVADPHGAAQRPLAEAEYVAFVDGARDLLATLRAAGTGGASYSARQVQILMHPGLDHAVVVKLPSAAEAKAMFRDNANTDQGPQTEALLEYQLSSRMLWPAEGTREKQDLMDMLPLAFSQAYPEELYNALGWKGAKVKKKA